MKEQVIKRLPTFSFFEELKAECIELMNKVPFKPNMTQIALQVRDPKNITENDWYEACGGIYKKNQMPIFELEYSHIHPDLAGSYIEKWIELVGPNIYRTRLLLVPGRKCYSIHKDPSPRIHIPIITNEQCLMCFPDYGIMEHLPATGESYWVDTTLNHTMINCSSIDRIHLVACVRD